MSKGADKEKDATKKKEFNDAIVKKVQLDKDGRAKRDGKVKVNGKEWKWKQGATGASPDKKQNKAKSYLYKYAYDIGGIVPQDDMAFLHAKEAVLTPEQTRILRNDLLGSNPNSLASLLLDFRAAYENL